MNCIGIVGPCASGKTTLIRGLRLAGLPCKHIAQEHSYVPDMWRKITNPDVLIYLDVSYKISMSRRKLDWTESEFRQQVLRLQDAKIQSDLYIDTDLLPPELVLKITLSFLECMSFVRDSSSKEADNVRT